ncbi:MULTISPECIES: RNA polymerase sigma factor SigM [Pseudofrankia]|uniref:RNA polymerase sigma factor SigM n=1 Tax=Pseudofrankia TaxID=2994363 RepID=UPI000234C1DC|nr:MULTISPECIES: RNA polymerase sigma factor SigM [Pseudofrankia]
MPDQTGEPVPGSSLGVPARPGQAQSTAESESPPADPADAGSAWSDDPDAALLRRHVDGDPAAFAELFRANADRLWSVAYRLLHDAEDAADAVQEAMLSAHRRAAGFRGESTVRTWLHRITVNAALDRLRRKAARPLTVPMPTSPDGVEHEPADPRDAHAEGELRLDIEGALARLPPALRAAVVLVDVEGMPVAEAAAALGVPVGTVKSRAARGRARLAEQLGHLRPGNQQAVRSVLEKGEVMDGGV